MSGVLVVRPQNGNDTFEEHPRANMWSIESGVLNIHEDMPNGNSRVVISYAPHAWDSVCPMDNDDD